MPEKKKKRVYSYKATCVFVSDTDPTERLTLINEAEEIQRYYNIKGDCDTSGLETEVYEVRTEDVLHAGPIYELRDTVLLGPPTQLDNKETVKQLLLKPKLSSRLKNVLHGVTSYSGFSDDEIAKIVNAVDAAETS